MSKEERGAKRLCEECGNKFYDLNKNPIICPVCSTPFVLAKPKTETKAAAKEAPKEVVESEEDLTTTDESAPEIVSLDDAAAEEAGADDEDEDAKLVDLGDEDDEIPDDDADADVFLEEEDDDGSDVTGIVGSVDDEET